jgi:hypothetical protein
MRGSWRVFVRRLVFDGFHRLHDEGRRLVVVEATDDTPLRTFPHQQPTLAGLIWYLDELEYWFAGRVAHVDRNAREVSASCHLT